MNDFVMVAAFPLQHQVWVE